MLINHRRSKLAGKKWTICGECEYFYECKAGKNKMNGISSDSPVYREIGCYNHEQYFQQINGRQLSFFNN